MRGVTLAGASLLLAGALGAQAPTHPLDGLSAAEHWTVAEVLRASGRLDSTARFLYESLREPPKAEVLGWRPGTPFRREAFVHLAQGGRGYEAVVDIAGRRVVDWREVTDRQFMATREESQMAAGAALGNAQFRAGLTRRQLDPSDVVCFPINHGYNDLAEERGRRLVRVSCQDGRRVVSGWGAPIEGLIAVVDLKSGTVVRVIDTGARPRAPLPGEHHGEAIGATRPALPPLVISQPQGPGFTLDGRQVSWDRWRFHFRIDPRRGVVISRVRWQDGERERPVLYQASLSELFVPYHDPNEPWSYQSYYDLGTYPSVFGGIASSLEPGEDCPDHARYFSYYVASEQGAPVEMPRVACLFEQPGAEPAWHHDRENGVVDARARRDLVLRMFMGAGNYDYLFDWTFKQDGSIRVTVAATGMDQMKGANAERSSAAETKYGRFVAPYLIGVNHSHFFNYRIDFDVDGPANTFVADRLETEVQPSANPRRSVWRVNSIEARAEKDGQRMSTMDAPEVWRVINPAVTGPTGDPVGFMLEGHGARTLMASDDYMRRRAGFTDHTVWVTPHAPGELFAAGDYPTAGVAGQGLPEWTKGNRPIANTDIVLWYTIGFHHVPRPEDYPVMSLELHGFDLKPMGFFTRNPAIDLPRRR